ncbi:hypothetical protein E2562_025646 [Oryza meyeriana var. granulata]|uniref:Uncharacterized protein n=1 Tax=Oryza meyeriana var. granulata TaxID=110450 RepID=A0A6G1FCG8_9ORYZ|nr:hypothetical protein E2562_025646 [Oryza meyeriana var. granulata]
MDSTVDSIAAAYGALLDAVAALIAEPVRTTRAIQDLRHRLDAFLASCDRADELVRATAHRVALAARGATCTDADDAIAHPDDHHHPLQPKDAGDQHDNN